MLCKLYERNVSQTNTHTHTHTCQKTVRAQPHNDLPWSNVTKRGFRHFSLLGMCVCVLRERQKDVENQAKPGNTPTHTNSMSISRANYISPLVFTHYHKSVNTSLVLVTRLKTTADLWNSLVCHYGASWLALTSVWTTYWPVQIAPVKRPTGLKPIQN